MRLPLGREPFDKLRVPSRVEELEAERLRRLRLLAMTS